MILDQLTNLHRYIPALPALETVSSILESGVLKTQEFGSYKTNDPRVRYNLFTYTTEKQRAEVYEVHRKEIDVQILLSGFERMEIADSSTLEVTHPYDEAKDALFGPAQSKVTFHADPSVFALFFPGEPHGPNLIDTESSTVVKVVFKVLAE
jgi:biofilm protein TabA